MYLLHCAPVSAVEPAVMLMCSFFLALAWPATASAAEEVGTSRMMSAFCRSYISWALVFAMSGLFWWSAVTTSIVEATALSPYFFW